MKLKLIYRKLKPYLKILATIAAIITIFVFVKNNFLRKNEVTIKVEKKENILPVKIHNDFYNLINNIDENETLDHVSKELINFYEFLFKSPDILIITINNNSFYEIRNLHLKLKSVKELTNFNISSLYLSEKEKKEILNNINYDKKRGVVNIKGINYLQAKSSLIIFLWGNFDRYNIYDSIELRFDGGKGKIIYSKEFYGSKVFIINNVYKIIFGIIIIFSILYIIGIKKYSKKIK